MGSGFFVCVWNVVCGMWRGVHNLAQLLLEVARLIVVLAQLEREVAQLTVKVAQFRWKAAA